MACRSSGQGQSRWTVGPWTVVLDSQSSEGMEDSTPTRPQPRNGMRRPTRDGAAHTPTAGPTSTAEEKDSHSSEADYSQAEVSGEEEGQVRSRPASKQPRVSTSRLSSAELRPAPLHRRTTQLDALDPCSAAPAHAGASTLRHADTRRQRSSLHVDGAARASTGSPARLRPRLKQLDAALTLHHRPDAEQDDDPGLSNLSRKHYAPAQ